MLLVRHGEGIPRRDLLVAIRGVEVNLLVDDRHTGHGVPRGDCDLHVGGEEIGLGGGDIERGDGDVLEGEARIGGVEYEKD